MEKRFKITNKEKIMLEKMREDATLRKAVFRYFEALADIELPEDCYDA